MKSPQRIPNLTLFLRPRDWMMVAPSPASFSAVSALTGVSTAAQVEFRICATDATGAYASSRGSRVASAASSFPTPSRSSLEDITRVEARGAVARAPPAAALTFVWKEKGPF